MRSTLSETEILKSLLDNNYISEEDTNKALADYPRGTVIDNLIGARFFSKEIIGHSIAETFKVGYFNLQKSEIKEDTLNIIPKDIVNENRVLAFKVDNYSISVTTDRVEQIEEIKDLLETVIPKYKVEIFYSLTEDIDEILLRFKDPFQDRINTIFESGTDFTNKFLDELFSEAYDLKASDIHFEPQSETVLLRIRVDGLLREVGEVPVQLYENILNRIKVMSNIRIDQRYRTQDGAIRFSNDKFAVDLRVSIVPVLDGQKIVIRILTNYTKNLNIRDLGFSEANFSKLEKAYKKPFGMILTTGPTGSGKTTTLYSIIKILLNPQINITTIEDPVEFRIPGINQIQVNAENEITFARGLRSIVRQDPNVMLVGEIRDVETAEIAVNAALTGHLLLSTFHANDAATAIPRLVDMGIEPFLLASTLNLIVAQRLIRKICDSCKVSHEYTHDDLEELMPYSKEYFKDEKIRLYSGKGCQKCNFTGYRGRIGIFELIEINDELQSLILTKSSSSEIWNVAKENGAISFFEDGLDKVRAGLTTIEEVLRVAPAIEKKMIYKNLRKLNKK